jgi:hypothetical protein
MTPNHSTTRFTVRGALHEEGKARGDTDEQIAAQRRPIGSAMFATKSHWATTNAGTSQAHRH